MENLKLKNSNFLIIGQLKTSRTETLEKYLREKVSSLGIIGLMSPFAAHNESRCTFYENGIKTKEFLLPSFIIKRVTRLNYPLLTISFVVYIFAIFKSFFQLNRKFEIFIGIATFSTMIGLILKKMKLVNKVIYYCIDYYPPPSKIGFDSLLITIYRKVDAWAVRSADIVWGLSPYLKDARERYSNISAKSYSELIVPLGYTNDVVRGCPMEKRERWTLGFVGTLTESQGLQLVIDAMPRLIEKLPKIKVRIIGHGPYASQLKKAVKNKGLENRFIFHGFVRDDNETYDILSRCMIGLAPWTGEATDNSRNTDPGKPKLYALLGLPIIITSTTPIAQLVDRTGAGIVINYSINDFVLAIEEIIGTEKNFLAYLHGIERFKPYCLAESIFNQAFLETFQKLNVSHE